MNNVVLASHPLIEHSLTILRSKDTNTAEFRQHAAVVSRVLLIEATKNLALDENKIVTPLAPFGGKALKDEIVTVPVMRSGLAMLFAIQDFLPSAAVGFIGLERDEQTAIAREYYRKLPKMLSSNLVMVLDPMLATGGSLDDTITAIKNKGAKRIMCLCIVSATEGLARVTDKHPDLTIYTAAIDQDLTNEKYILPGLGDFGDRYFGT